MLAVALSSVSGGLPQSETKALPYCTPPVGKAAGVVPFNSQGYVGSSPLATLV